MKLFLPTVKEEERKEKRKYELVVEAGEYGERKDIGGYSEGVPPLPIPNREVKPLSADGTAKVGE